MAEVGILIIFVLLLLIGLREFRRVQALKAMAGREVVPTERLRSMENAEAMLAGIREPLGLSQDASIEEIRRLVRALQEYASSPGGLGVLTEARAALQEMRDVRDQLQQAGGSDLLTKRLEEQTYRIANQEGQLQRYEQRLEEAGLGKGERPCWVRPDGTIEYLYDVVLASNGIRMREHRYDHREAERSSLPMPVVDPNETLSATEFLRRTQPLYNHSLAVNCRFFVVVYDATGPAEKEIYKGLLRTVEGHFYKRLDRDPAPF